MLSTFSFAYYADWLIILSGVLLCLKRVAEMERYHMLRVVVLTSILSCFVVIFFLAYGFTLGNPGYHGCMIEFSPTDVDHY
jgi:hypothetical protein